MIKMTDNLYEFRKLVLSDFIKEGYKYIARDKDGEIFAYSRKPTKLEKSWIIISDPNAYQNISLVSFILTDVKWEDEKPFEIPCTNWKEVPVDTPVVYSSYDGNNYVRHFCKYDEANDRVVLYSNGRTSFTEQGIMETHPERVTIYKQGEKLNDGNNNN